MISEETRLKMRLAKLGKTTWNKGKKLSEEHKNKLRLAKLGKKQTKEHIENAAKTRIGKERSEETKKKISVANKGHIMSDKQRKQISDFHKGRTPWNKGIEMWKDIEHPRGALGRKDTEKQIEGKRKRMLGKKIALGYRHTEEWKEKMSLIMKSKPFTDKKREQLKIASRNSTLTKKSGKDNPMWKGGIERKKWNNNLRRVIKLGNGGSHTFESWEELKKTYNYTCPCCGRKEPEVKMTRDHIIPLSKGGTDNIDNLQPLCLSCNCKKYNKIIKYELVLTCSNS